MLTPVVAFAVQPWACTKAHTLGPDWNRMHVTCWLFCDICANIRTTPGTNCGVSCVPAVGSFARCELLQSAYVKFVSTSTPSWHVLTSALCAYCGDVQEMCLNTYQAYSSTGCHPLWAWIVTVKYFTSQILHMTNTSHQTCNLSA